MHFANIIANANASRCRFILISLYRSFIDILSVILTFCIQQNRQTRQTSYHFFLHIWSKPK